MMIMIRVLLTAVVTVAIVACATLRGGGSDFSLPDYKEFQLSNGLKVLMVPDNKLPYVSAVMLVKAGSRLDPDSKSGLSTLVAELLDKGTQQRGATELADSLGQIGSEFSANVYRDYTMISVSGLSMYQDQMLKDFFEIVTESSFQDKEIRRTKARLVSAIQREVDDPGGFASKLFNKYLYGEHPYAEPTMGSETSVRKIKRKDIIRHYLRYYRPNNALLAIVGQYNEDTRKWLEDNLADWDARALSVPDTPVSQQVKGINLKLITKSDLQQSQIRLGHMGIRRDNPDFLKLRVANTILGGAFASRLVDEIRDKRGLTYSINSHFDARKETGPFLVSTFTRHEKVGETVKETLSVIEKFKKNGVTEVEVNEAKALLRGMFPRALETVEALASNLLILRYYGISDDYLSNYLDNISDITAHQVNQVIDKYFHPNNIKVLVYSKRQAAQQLKPLGDLEVQNYQLVR